MKKRREIWNFSPSKFCYAIRTIELFANIKRVLFHSRREEAIQSEPPIPDDIYNIHRKYVHVSSQ